MVSAHLRHPAGRLLGDCDLMRSTSASRTCQRWSGDARSATSVKRADGTALSVIVVLFDHHKSLRNHRDTRTLEQYPILSPTISVMPRETLKHTARGSAHASEPKSRRTVHDENVHEMELPKDPVIVVGGGELIARELAAREHHPAAETTAAPSPSRSDRGRTWSAKQLLRVIKMDGVDVDRHPCARKQVRIVRFARREHGWGGASDAAKEQQLVKGSRWVSREDRT